MDQPEVEQQEDAPPFLLPQGQTLTPPMLARALRRQQDEEQAVRRVMGRPLQEDPRYLPSPDEVAKAHERSRLRVELVWGSVSRNPIKRVRSRWQLRRKRAELFPDGMF